MWNYIGNLGPREGGGGDLHQLTDKISSSSRHQVPPLVLGKSQYSWGNLTHCWGNLNTPGEISPIPGEISILLGKSHPLLGKSLTFSCRNSHFCPRYFPIYSWLNSHPFLANSHLLPGKSHQMSRFISFSQKISWKTVSKSWRDVLPSENLH